MNKRTKKITLYQQLKHEWGELDLACKAVFIIGIILILELIYAIFFCHTNISPSVDGIFRTSLSSIFGYILGMNLPHHSTKVETSPKKIIEEPNDPILKKEKPILIATNIRALFAMLICITCIIVLIVANCTHHLAYTDGINQVGHLISTTIGFLISNSSHDQTGS